MATYTYSIFDGNSACVWPSHNGLKIEAADVREAAQYVGDVLSEQARRLRRADGYEVGDVVIARVYEEDGIIVASPRYALTADDLGEEE